MNFFRSRIRIQNRRFQTWIRDGKFVESLQVLARYLHERGKLNLDEAFVDAPFASAKRGFAVGPTRRGKGTKIVAIAAGDGLPIAVIVEGASHAECQLVEAVLAGCLLDQLAQRLIGDKAYDSAALDEQVTDQYGIEVIAPNRRSRRRKDPGRKTVAPLPKTLESRTPLCMDAQLPE